MTNSAPPGNSTEIRQHLERVLASSTLAKSKSLGRLLRYLVEQALNEGAAGEVKEATLGVEVFDRGPEFDPREDNIVRVQARNLRTKLADYYAEEGKDEPIRIDMPKGGYTVQFRSLRAEARAEPETQAPAVPKRRWLLPAAIILIAVILAAGWWIFDRDRAPGSATAHVVAVLPFSNVDPSSGLEYFADGLAEELINSLAALDGLSVIARTSSFQFRAAGEPDLGQINAKLNASEVVEGSVRRDGTQIRVTVRLIAVPSGKTVWSGQYDRPLDNVLKTEEEIAYGVSTALKLKLVPSRPSRDMPATTAQAHNLYLQGRYYWEKVDPANAAKAKTLFEQALELDPNYAPPYVGLAGAYGTEVVWNTESARRGWPKVKALLTKALQLDETNAEAHTLMGGVAAWYELDYAKSEREYRRGVELGPGDVRTHQYFASMLGAMGRFAEAEAEMKATLRLDPLHPFARWADAQLEFWKGNYGGAEAKLEAMHRENPGFLYTYRLLVPVLSQMGKHDQAIALAKEFAGLAPDTPGAYSILGEAYGRAGQNDQARQMLAKLRELARYKFVSPFDLALIYTALEDHPAALRGLNASIEERAFRAPWLRVDPRFRSLRSEPEFARLLQIANLSPQ